MIIDTIKTDRKIYAEPSIVHPISVASKNILSQRDHALIGISPFNSYYSETNIFNIIHWVNNNFKSFNIFFPADLSIYTLLGMGLSKDKAEKKVRRQSNYTFNKIFRALKKVFPERGHCENLIISIDDLKNNEKYLKKMNIILKLFNENFYFYDFCIKTTKKITFYKGMETIDEFIAVNYFLEELPLLIDTPGILSIPSSLFIYHDIPEAINELYNEKVFDLIGDNQGYLRVNFN